METQPNRKKNNPKKGIGKWIGRILLTLVALVVGAMVLFALRQGSMTAAVNRGVTLTPASTNPPPTQSTEPEPTEETEPPTEASTEPVDPELELAQQYLSAMSLEEKVCQLILSTPDEITGVYGASQAAEGTSAALQSYPIGGVVYERQNLYGVEQLSQMIANTQGYSAIPLFIGIEEEGGNVAPLTSIGVTEYYSTMSVYGQEENAERISQIGLEMAEDLRSVGINFNLAPVADVLTDPYDTEIGSRSFGADAPMTAQLAVTMLRSLQEGGVTACMKYFPGLASADGDTRYGQAASQRTLEELRQQELLPFEAGIEAGAQMIMVSHMSLPNVTGDDTPCDLSYAVVTDLLRRELGYGGLILTDSHEKAAITYYYDGGEAAVLAIQAGCDMILQPDDLEEAVVALLAAVENGELTEERINESVLRILYLKIQMGLITE